MPHDEQGREVLDTTPVAIPARRRVDSRSLSEMRRLIREELSREAMQQGNESFEEANDYDVEEDEALPVSAHEYTEMQEEHLRDSLQNIGTEAAQRREKERVDAARRIDKVEQPAVEPAADDGGEEKEEED